MKIKKWKKLSNGFGIVIMYYALVQLVYTVNYIKTQKLVDFGMIKVCANTVRFILLFAPIIIFGFRLRGQKSRKIFLDFWRKYWVIYLIYLIVLYLIRENIILGYYYVEFYIIGLSKSVSSAFLMAYIYMLFKSTIAILFFALLPNYILIFRKWNENAKQI